MFETVLAFGVNLDKMLCSAARINYDFAWFLFIGVVKTFTKYGLPLIRETCFNFPKVSKDGLTR